MTAGDVGFASWQARAPKTRLLFGLVLAALALRAVLGVMEFSQRSDTAHPDFFGLWSFAAFAARADTATIYDSWTLQQFQRGLDATFPGFYPFAYPPPMLLLLQASGLGALPFGVARTAFALGSLALFAALTVGFASAPRGHLAALLAAHVAAGVALLALVAPVSLYTVFVGQNGLFFGAVLLGGLLALPRRPLLAGCLFALLACKPQYGLLLPFALLGLRAWRAMRATTLAIALLGLVSIAIHGWAPWPAWLAHLPEFSAMFLAQQDTFLPLMASPAAGLMRLGMAPGPAMAAQIVISATLAGAVFWLFRRAPGPAAHAALLPAVALASPYSFIYDAPVALACLAWLYAERERRDGAFALWEILVMLAALLAPALLLHPEIRLPAVAISQLGLFILAARVAWRANPVQNRTSMA